MTRKHETPEYRRNAKLIRQSVRAVHRRGDAVPCWRCHRAIAPGQPFDVGHLPGAVGSSMAELAPEHRHATGVCVGNRSAGGTAGAQRARARRTSTTPSTDTTTWRI